jgi:hypothetical protein
MSELLSQEQIEELLNGLTKKEKRSEILKDYKEEYVPPTIKYIPKMVFNAPKDPRPVLNVRCSCGTKLIVVQIIRDNFKDYKAHCTKCEYYVSVSYVLKMSK